MQHALLYDEVALVGCHAMGAGKLLHLCCAQLYFLFRFLFVFSFFLSPSSCLLSAGLLFSSLSQIILPGFLNKFIFCKRILLYQVLHPYQI